MDSTAFLTDKYELTQLQATLKSGKAFEKATFELFARKLPKGRRYGVVGGVNRAIEAIRNFTFTDDELQYLENDPAFTSETVEYLRNYSFKGSITGYREGDVYFPYSPILTIEGTFGDAVILETVLLSILNHDSAVMSAASRMVQAARGVPIIEMGSRRTHEIAAVDSARAAYVSGFAASSNLESGLKYGVPTTGTSAHAFTLLFEDEKEAFQEQVDALGVGTTLLVDTYDIQQGIRNAIEVAGTSLGGIRIDSGDLHEETLKARKLLDDLGATKTKIVLSSDIDEFAIDEMMDQGTPVDGIGAGTRVVTGSGHPTAGMVFKLVERQGLNNSMIPVAKKSSGKKSVGGRKNPYRTFDSTGTMTGEFYSLHDDSNENRESLQVKYVDQGIFMEIDTIDELREKHQMTMNTLPDEGKEIRSGEPLFIVGFENNENK